MEFIKYQSLGNDFILFDWQKQSTTQINTKINSQTWPSYITSLCNRHTGIGSDGVLILSKKTSFIFNADGSNGDLCLNGARCIAHYLYTQKKYPKPCTICMGNQKIKTTFEKQDNEIIITQYVSSTNLFETKTITISSENIAGYYLDIGNPHFVVFQKKVPTWLKQYGQEIEQHPIFPKKTNVEFIWNDENKYSVLVYERGCGITQSCSSGATAITNLLFLQNKIKTDQQIRICMLGGSLISWITSNKQIALQAKASFVFKGIQKEALKAS